MCKTNILYIDDSEIEGKGLFASGDLDVGECVGLLARVLGDSNFNEAMLSVQSIANDNLRDEVIERILQELLNSRLYRQACKIAFLIVDQEKRDAQFELIFKAQERIFRIQKCTIS